jgi:hypothetical protein
VFEDDFGGKPLGVDVCCTNHAEADQDDMDNLLTPLAADAPVLPAPISALPAMRAAARICLTVDRLNRRQACADQHATIGLSVS